MMSSLLMRTSERKCFRAVSIVAIVLVVVFLVPDTAVVEGARLLLQGGPEAVERASPTPENEAPSKPELNAAFPGSTCEAELPQLMELSQVAAKSPAMAQAIGPCRWGNQPNNVATPTGLEGNCIVGFDSNVYILKFDLFSVCRFAYEKYNITTLVSVSNFGGNTLVLNVDAIKTFSSSQTSLPPAANPSSPPPDLSIDGSRVGGGTTPSMGSNSPAVTWPSTAPSSNAPLDSPVTVKPSTGENTWKPPTSKPTWTRPQPPAVPPCEGFNCNEPDSSSDAGKSDDKDSKDEDSQSSSNSDSDSDGVKPSSSDSDSDSDGVMKKGSSSYHTQTDCKGFNCHSSGGTSSAEDKSQDRDKSDEDEQSSSQSDSDSDRSLDVSDSASDSDSDGNLAPFKKHTGPSSSDDKDDCLGAECNDDKTGKSSDEGQSDDKDPKDIDGESSSQSDSDSDRSTTKSSASDSDSDGNFAPVKRHTGRSESQDEDDCMGENCNEDNKSSDRDVSEDEDVSEEDKEKSSQSDSDSDSRVSKESASDSDSDGEITKPDWVTDEPEPTPESAPEMEPEDMNEEEEEEAEEDEELEEEEDEDDEEDAEDKEEDEEEDAQGGPEMEPEDIEGEADMEDEDEEEDEGRRAGNRDVDELLDALKDLRDGAIPHGQGGSSPGFNPSGRRP